MHTPWSALPPPDGEQCGCMHASAPCFEFDSSYFLTFTSDSPSVLSPFKEDGDANGDAPSWSSMPPPAQLVAVGPLPPGPVNEIMERQEKRAGGRAGGTTGMTPSSSSNHHQMAGRNRRSHPRRCSRYSNSRRMVWWRTGSTIGFDWSAGRLVLVTSPPILVGVTKGWGHRLVLAENQVERLFIK